MHTNGNGPSGLAEVMAGLAALIEGKQAEVDALAERLVVEQTALRRLKAMERAGTGVSGLSGRPKTKEKRVRHGEEELRIVLSQIDKLAPDQWADPEVRASFAAGTLRDHLGMGKSHANRVIEALRLRDDVRLIGERRIGKATRPSRVFVLTGNDE